MKIGAVSCFYFSPTGNTRRAMKELMKAVAENGSEYDVTGIGGSSADYHFSDHELVLVGAPVYGGRLPEPAVRRFEKLYGKNTPAVLVVTYGNRDYDDALLELKLVMERQGFRVLAAAAVVAEHNIVPVIGAGRPDQKDCHAIHEFGGRIREKAETLTGSHQIGTIAVRGNVPFREYGGIPLKPRAGRACTQCGLCIRKCPVQAISRTDARVTDQERCISCMGCIAICPAHARSLNPMMRYMSSRMLKKKCTVARKPEFYIAAAKVRA